MKGCASGELLFRWVCLVLLSYVETLTWTAQPSNPTVVIRGHDVALRWRYSLSAEEQTKSQTYFVVKWTKLNDSSSSYDEVANYVKITGLSPAYTEQAPHNVVDRATGTSFASLQINDVRMDAEGIYKIEISVEFPGTVIAADHEVNLTVSVPPEIGYVSSDQDVCEGPLVSLSCNATGKPTPSITWTRVADGAQLPAVDGNYVMSNIQRSSNGTYRCTADNGAGNPVNRTVQVRVRYSPSVDTIVNSSNTVNERSSFYMTCEASGDPPPNVYTWKRNDTNDVVANGNILNFTHINRNDAGLYKCEATNQCGMDAGLQFVDVYYPPTITYISGNKTVNDTNTVSLICTADGNPTPSITWTKSSNVVPSRFNISGRDSGGNYTCIAVNGIGSSDSMVIFITVENYRPTNPSSLSTNVRDNTVAMGTSFTLNCSAQANPPAKYRFYRGQESLYNSTVGRNFEEFTTSVNKRETPVIFTCIPFNEYGDGPTQTVSVTVQFNPVTVTLVTNTPDNEDCSESMWVNFTCVASEANPAVTNYQLIDSRGATIVSNSGTWIKEISEKGKHVYSCLVEHHVGNVTSANNVTLTLNVPVQISLNVAYGSEILKEGGDVYLYCNVTGFPHPTITWTKDGVVAAAERTSWLNFTNMNRDKSGNYTCHANNTCGKTSSLPRRIEVLYEPENVTLNVNVSSNQVCAGIMLKFSCEADANPGVGTYRLYKNGDMIANMAGSGVLIRTLNTGGQFNCRCEASNSVGTGTSNNITLIVKVPALVISTENKIVREGDNLTLFCNVSGIPSPNVSWINAKNELMKVGATLQLPDINKSKRGKYKCITSNRCGNDSKTAFIDVQYAPTTTVMDPNITALIGSSAYINFSCPVDGNPEPAVTWYNGSDINGTLLESGKLFMAKESGCYTCYANNSLGSITVKNCLVFVIPVIIRITLTIKNIDCNDFPVEEFRKEVEKLYGPSLTTVDIVKTRCGSVIVDLALWFNQIVNESDVISVMKTAAQQGNLGNFSVEPNSIRETSPSPTGSPPPTTSLSTTGRRSTEEITEIIRITLIITNKDCKTFPEGEFRTEVERIVRHLGLKSFEIKTRCGSVIIDLVLVFNQSVSESDVISALRTAAQQDKFGQFSVDPDSIKQTSQSPTASTSPTSKGGTQASVCKKTWIKNTDCSTIVWVIVVLALAGVVIIALVIGIAAWCVHKKRQHGKDPRTQVFEFQARPRYS